MGYALEKKIINGKKRLLRTIAVVVLVLVLCAGVVFSLFYPPETWRYAMRLPDPGERAEGEMRIHFLDVGQGDATIIEFPDGKTMLVDGGDGEESTSDTVIRYLNALGIDTLDYLLVTHADSDHCGSLDTVLKYKNVKRAFLPKTLETVNDEYAAFYAELMKEACEITYSQNGVDLSVSEGETPYRLCFLAPSKYETDGKTEFTEEESNAFSAVVWLDYNGVSTLLTGDAPKTVEEKLVFSDSLGLFDNYGVELDSTEILKVAHHGSADSTGAEFVSYLHAQTAVISCGENNAYGHPTAEACAALTANGVDVYRTDLHGGVIVSVPKGASTWKVQTYGRT